MSGFLKEFGPFKNQSDAQAAVTQIRKQELIQNVFEGIKPMLSCRLCRDQPLVHLQHHNRRTSRPKSSYKTAQSSDTCKSRYQSDVGPKANNGQHVKSVELHDHKTCKCILTSWHLRRRVADILADIALNKVK